MVYRTTFELSKQESSDVKYLAKRPASLKTMTDRVYLTQSCRREKKTLEPSVSVARSSATYSKYDFMVELVQAVAFVTQTMRGKGWQLCQATLSLS